MVHGGRRPLSCRPGQHHRQCSPCARKLHVKPGQGRFVRGPAAGFDFTAITHVGWWLVVKGQSGPGDRRAASQVAIDLVNRQELFSADRVPEGLRPGGGAASSIVAGMPCDDRGGGTRLADLPENQKPTTAWLIGLR